MVHWPGWVLWVVYSVFLLVYLLQPAISSPIFIVQLYKNYHCIQYSLFYITISNALYCITLGGYCRQYILFIFYNFYFSRPFLAQFSSYGYINITIRFRIFYSIYLLLMHLTALAWVVVLGGGLVLFFFFFQVRFFTQVVVQPPGSLDRIFVAGFLQGFFNRVYRDKKAYLHRGPQTSRYPYIYAELY